MIQICLSWREYRYYVRRQMCPIRSPAHGNHGGLPMDSIIGMRANGKSTSLEQYL